MGKPLATGSLSRAPSSTSWFLLYRLTRARTGHRALAAAGLFVLISSSRAAAVRKSLLFLEEKSLAGGHRGPVAGKQKKGGHCLQCDLHGGLSQLYIIVQSIQLKLQIL